jgi:hypothetical protein
MLERERHEEAKRDAESHRYAKVEEEDADAVEDGLHKYLRAVELREGSLFLEK